MLKQIGKRLAFGSHHHQRGGLERFDESTGIPDGNDVIDPLPLIAAGTILHDPRRFGCLRVLAEKFGRGLVIGYCLRRVDVTAVDVVLVFDLPGPTGIHRLRRSIRKDWLGCSIPTTDHGAIAEERTIETQERFAESTADQLASEPAGI